MPKDLLLRREYFCLQEALFKLLYRIQDKIILSKGESPQICNKKPLFWFQLNLDSKVEKHFSFHFSLSLLFILRLFFAVSIYRNLLPCKLNLSLTQLNRISPLEMGVLSWHTFSCFCNISHLEIYVAMLFRPESVSVSMKRAQQCTFLLQHFNKYSCLQA